jgi:hypothetical protein
MNVQPNVQNTHCTALPMYTVKSDIPMVYTVGNMENPGNPGTGIPGTAVLLARC